jgi:hypothetical protein
MSETAEKILGRAHNNVHIALQALEHDELTESKLALVKALLTKAKEDHAQLEKHLHKVRVML